MRVAYSGRFKRDVRLAQRRGKDMGKLKETMFLIMEGKPLPGHCREHMLAGPWKGVMDAHVEPDWLLLYTRGDGFVRFERTGSHADLFAL